MKIICIGRNYAEHAKELGNEIPENPVIFMKPDTAVLKKGSDFYLPEFSNDVHYELEVVVKISKGGKYIQEENASKHYDEIALGIDFTARDLQSQLKGKGLPWEFAKGLNTPSNTVLIFGISYILLEKLSPKIFEMEIYQIGLILLTFLSSWLLISPIKMIAMKFKSKKLEDNYPKVFLVIGALLILAFFQLTGIPLVIIYYIIISLIFQKQL